jgi:hypothetical protein
MKAGDKERNDKRIKGREIYFLVDFSFDRIDRESSSPIVSRARENVSSRENKTDTI